MRGSPFYTEPAFHIADYKRTGNLDFEGGIRWSRSFEGSDIAVMAARLTENQLTYSAPANPLDDAVSKNKSFSLLGFSANRAHLFLPFLDDSAFFADLLLPEGGISSRW